MFEWSIPFIFVTVWFVAAKIQNKHSEILGHIAHP